MAAYLGKVWRENLREWKVLVLTLVFAPFFVTLMYAYFQGASPSYALLVVNHDRGAGVAAEEPGAAGLLAAWRAAVHTDRRPMLAVSESDDLPAALARLERRQADLVVEIPAGFSRRLAAYRPGADTAPAALVDHGDEANARSAMAMAVSDYVAAVYAAAVTRAPFPLQFDVRRVAARRTLTEFDLYVPALLVLAVIMVMFTAAATLIREVDKGTATRLMLSRLRTWELLAAVTVSQLAIGLASLALAYLAAWSVGYRSDGSLLAVLVVGAVATLGVVAVSVLVAAFLSTIFELLTVGCFPFFILMFFSESMMPLPKITLAELAGHALYANDVLPTSLAVRALGRVLNHGAGVADVAFELTAALALTAAYFLLGGWLFTRRHYRLG